MPFSYHNETRELNELTRKEASGSFVQLSDGVTHYELSNPEAGNTIVLVHGFSVPYFLFDPTFEFLTQSGFRVLRYDLFGRGYSDRPDTRYNIDLFVRQLGELLEALGMGQPVSLVGLSMGGPITAAFTGRCPERVNRLILIDPAGVRPVFPRLALEIVTLPGLGEMVLNWIGHGGMVRNIASDFFDPLYVENFQSQYVIQMQYQGFRRAILSTVRNGMLGSFMEEYIRVGKAGKSVLLLWGRQDRTVPFHQSLDLRRAIPEAEFHVIEDCGHIPHYERQEEVNPILLSFLKG